MRHQQNEESGRREREAEKACAAAYSKTQSNEVEKKQQDETRVEVSSMLKNRKTIICEHASSAEFLISKVNLNSQEEEKTYLRTCIPHLVVCAAPPWLNIFCHSLVSSSLHVSSSSSLPFLHTGKQCEDGKIQKVQEERKLWKEKKCKTGLQVRGAHGD
eukprot:3595285-Rhodomonas_salina.1